MKRLLTITVGLFIAAALTVNAAEEKKKEEKSAEQKQLLKDMKRKYDANSDKKLDESELAKVSAEDKEKMEKAGVWPKGKGKEGKEKKEK